MTPREWAERILNNRALWEGKESFIQIVGDEIGEAINEDRQNRRLYFALQDILKRVPPLIEEGRGKAQDLGDRERWLKSIEDSLRVVREEHERLH